MRVQNLEWFLCILEEFVDVLINCCKWLMSVDDGLDMSVD